MTLDQYLTEIGRYPLLTPERELEVARASKAGNPDSKKLLINSNLRLVVNIAKRYSRDNILPDLIGEGNMALINAAEKYNPEKDAKFSTYAFRGIERRIWSYLDKQKMIRLPPQQKALMRTIYRISNEHLIANNEEPTPQHIADELNKQQSKKKYTENNVKELVHMYKNISVESLNKPIRNDGNSEKMDFIPGKDGRDIVKHIENKHIANVLRDAISKLNGIDKEIIELSYKQNNLEEIAKALDKPIEHIRERRERGLRSLKSKLRCSGIFGN